MPGMGILPVKRHPHHRRLRFKRKRHPHYHRQPSRRRASLGAAKGRLIWELHRREQRIFVQDGSLKLPVLQERLGKQDYNNLPGNKQPVVYEYDEVDGKRRVGKVHRKS